MDLIYEIAGDQIDGARDYQEDAFLTTYLDDEGAGSRSSALVIMADGMGGHAAGNIASNLVVSTFNKTFTGRFGKDEIPKILRECLDKANDALREAIKETPALDGMGCTMVTAAFSRGKVYWVSVGDSHLYVIRDRELLKKNEDHSYGGYLDRMKAQGMDVEAEAGLSRNMLMSAMTGDEIAEVDCPEEGFRLLPGDRVIVASDGLDTLSAGTIIQTSSWSPSAKECVSALLRAVEEANRPRQDNTTVIVVDVLEADAPAPPAVEEVEAAPPPSAGDTQPLDAGMVREAISAEAEIEAEPEAPAPGARRGLVIGGAAAAVLAVAAGAYFLLGGGSEPPPAPAAAPATAAPATAAPATAAPAPATASPAAPASTSAPAPAAPPTAATAPGTPAPAAAPAAPEAPPGAPPTFRDPLASAGEGPVMVRLPGGTFEMGSSGLSVEADERPRHTVTVRPFAIGKYEVTFAEYNRFAAATGRKKPDNLYLDEKTHPVIFVTWDDAYAYTQWLSKETGHRYRLPSEAEWEYAASAGTTTPYWWGYDVGENRAHCFDCKTGLNPRQPTRVGRFPPNPFGLHDTAGNVFEWVHDCYHPNYKGAPADGSVWEGGDCAFRVARGGAYTSTAKSIRSQKRARFKSQGAYDTVGFRVARDL